MKKSTKKVKNRLTIPIILHVLIILTGFFVYQQYIEYSLSINPDGLSAPVNGAKDLPTGWRRFQVFYDKEFSDKERKNIRVEVPFEHTISYVSDYDIYSAIYKKERPELNIETDQVLIDFFSGYSRKKVLTIERVGKQLEKNTLYTLKVSSSGFNIFNFIFGPKQYLYTFSTGSSEEDENISRTAKLMSSLGSFAATYQSKENKEKEYQYYLVCKIEALDIGYNYETRRFDEENVNFYDEYFRSVDYSCDKDRNPPEEIVVDVKKDPSKGRTDFENLLKAHNVLLEKVKIVYIEN
jgi:hypothetical protein